MCMLCVKSFGIGTPDLSHAAVTPQIVHSLHSRQTCVKLRMLLSMQEQTEQGGQQSGNQSRELVCLDYPLADDQSVGCCFTASLQCRHNFPFVYTQLI